MSNEKNTPKKPAAPKNTANKKAANEPAKAAVTPPKSDNDAPTEKVNVGIMASHYQPVIQPVSTVETDINAPLKEGEIKANGHPNNDELALTSDQAPVNFAVAKIKAKNKNGFWRAKYHWPHEEIEVLVLHSLDDIAAVNAQLEGDAEFDVAITLADYERLDAEPNLVVSLAAEG